MEAAILKRWFSERYDTICKSWPKPGLVDEGRKTDQQCQNVSRTGARIHGPAVYANSRVLLQTLSPKYYISCYCIHSITRVGLQNNNFMQWFTNQVANNKICLCIVWLNFVLSGVFIQQKSITVHQWHKAYVLLATNWFNRFALWIVFHFVIVCPSV